MFESGEPRAQVALIPTGRLSLLPLHATILDEFSVTYAASAMALAVARDTARTRSGRARRLAGVGNPLPGLEQLTSLRDALRTALTAVRETAELAQPRADLARLLDFPVDELGQANEDTTGQLDTSLVHFTSPPPSLDSTSA